MSKGQQQVTGIRIPADASGAMVQGNVVTGGKPAPAPNYPAIPDGLTPAWFTDRELLELRKVCRDYDGELAERFLRDALKRADRSL